MSKPPKGLGADLDLVRRLIADDPHALDLFDQAVQGKQGRRTDLVDNVNEVPRVERPDGNSQTGALRRLRKDAPELQAEVLAGRLSAHAAMVQAGFRKRTVSVRVEEPESVAAAVRRHMKPEAVAALGELLCGCRQGR